MSDLTLTSLFSGSGGFELAGIMCGITPIYSSEVEKFPLEVEAARFPNVIQIGDVTKVDGRKLTPTSIVSFGSPCQDLSIAGKRAGLKHTAKGDEQTTRSGLFYEAIRIIEEMRDGDARRQRLEGISDDDIRFTTRFAIYENVIGAYSSNNGQDFRCVLEELARVKELEISISMPPKGKWKTAGAIVGDGWSIAWRTLDAQYWGVPQRRRRIFLVADFDGECAPKILFESESVSWNSEQSRETREEVARYFGKSINRASISEGGWF